MKLPFEDIKAQLTSLSNADFYQKVIDLPPARNLCGYEEWERFYILEELRKRLHIDN